MAPAILEPPVDHSSIGSAQVTIPLVETKRICVTCRQCLPLDQFARVRKGGEPRRHQCKACRTAALRKRRTEGERKTLQDANREIRKSRITRMAAIVEQLVDRAGGPNAFAKRWWELYRDGSVSFRRRCLETVMAMSVAQDRWKASERELQIERLKAGEIEEGDIREIRRKSDDELLDAMAGPLRALLQYDLLHEVLRRMRRQGELEGEQLSVLRDALR